MTRHGDQSARPARGRSKRFGRWAENQPGLFASPGDPAVPLPGAPKLPAHNDAPTSREAAERMAGKASAKRAEVRAWVHRCGRRGATRKEIAADLGMLIQTVCPRVDELLRSHLLVETGERRKGAAVLVDARCLAPESAKQGTEDRNRP